MEYETPFRDNKKEKLQYKKKTIITLIKNDNKKKYNREVFRKKDFNFQVLYNRQIKEKPIRTYAS